MASPCHILLVEDEPTLQRILGSVLSDAGHTVESVGTAEQAIERVEDVKAPEIDLVLADKNLPAMNGLDLLSHLRAAEVAHDLLRGFVLVTGYPSRDSATRLLTEGGDGYLVKPFRSLVHALQRVQSVLDAPLDARRAAHRLAVEAASALGGGGGGGAALRGAQVAVLLDDADLKARVESAARATGATAVEVDALKGAPDPAVLVAGRVEDLMTFGQERLGTALILADSGAAFPQLLELIHTGGATVLDPVRVPAEA